MTPLNAATCVNVLSTPNPASTHAAPGALGLGVVLLVPVAATPTTAPVFFANAAAPLSPSQMLSFRRKSFGGTGRPSYVVPPSARTLTPERWRRGSGGTDPSVIPQPTTVK